MRLAIQLSFRPYLRILSLHMGARLACGRRDPGSESGRGLELLVRDTQTCPGRAGSYIIQRARDACIHINKRVNARMYTHQQTYKREDIHTSYEGGKEEGRIQTCKGMRSNCWSSPSAVCTQGKTGHELLSVSACHHRPQSPNSNPQSQQLFQTPDRQHLEKPWREKNSVLAIRHVILVD